MDELSPEILKLGEECGVKLCTGLCDLIDDNNLTPLQASAVACNITVMMFTMILASGHKNPPEIVRQLFPAMMADTLLLIERVSDAGQD